MFNFGDEFVIQIYRIPWLLWIQLLVMLLLIILLYFFTSSSLDLVLPSAASAPPTSATICHADNSPMLADRSSGCSRDSKVGENERNKEAGTSREGGRISRKEEIEEETEGYSTMDASQLALFRRPLHPCGFLGAATQALLKCLGLDSSSSDSSSTRKPTEEHSCPA